MKHISVQESLDYYLTTLDYLNEKYINGPDDQLHDNLAELEGDAYTFLHQYTVNILLKAGLIPESVVSKTEIIRDLVLHLVDNWKTLDEVRNDSEWKKARQMAKVILNEIQTFQEKNK